VKTVKICVCTFLGSKHLEHETTEAINMVTLNWNDSFEGYQLLNIDIERVADNLDRLSAECWKNPPEPLFEKQSTWLAGPAVREAKRKHDQALRELIIIDKAIKITKKSKLNNLDSVVS